MFSTRYSRDIKDDFVTLACWFRGSHFIDMGSKRIRRKNCPFGATKLHASQATHSRATSSTATSTGRGGSISLVSPSICLSCFLNSYLALGLLNTEMNRVNIPLGRPFAKQSSLTEAKKEEKHYSSLNKNNCFIDTDILMVSGAFLLYVIT